MSRAAVWTGVGQLGVEDRTPTVCPPGWVLVRPDRVGLCGTDLTIVSGRHGRARPPLVLGHEITGIVEAPAAGAPAPGTRVVVDPTLSCGTCWPCRHHLTHTCRRLQLIGIDTDGALATTVAVPVANLISMDPTVPAELAVLAEPLAVAVHAVGRAEVAADDTVLIAGAGPIGILIGLVAAARGCRVLVSEPQAVRRHEAAELGFEVMAPDVALPAAVEQATDGVLSDVVFDCAGHPAVAATLAAVTRVRGTIVLAGLYSAPAAVDLHALTFDEQRVLGSRVYTREDLDDAVSLIQSGDLGLERLHTRSYPLAEAGDAFAAAARGDVLKVMVDPGA